MDVLGMDTERKKSSRIGETREPTRGWGIKEAFGRQRNGGQGRDY